MWEESLFLIRSLTILEEPELMCFYFELELHISVMWSFVFLLGLIKIL